MFENIYCVGKWTQNVRIEHKYFQRIVDESLIFKLFTITVN